METTRRIPAVGLVFFCVHLLRAATLAAAAIPLDPGELSPGDGFGQAVAISGDTAAVSANQDDAATGSVYVFRRTSGAWNLEQKLVPADATPGDGFGTFVAIDGDTIVIGSPGHEDRRGAAYVFARAGSVWSLQQQLEAPQRDEGDRFGTAVAISGETVLIGAPGDDEVAQDAGGVWAFVRSGSLWSFEQKLLVATAAANDTVGSDVAIDGDTAIVSAPHDDEAGPESGAAYAFVRASGSWTVQGKLTASDAVAGELLGSAVALSGDTAVVGAHYGYAAGVVTGASYVFTRSGGNWSEEQKLTAFDGTSPDDFGWAVGVAGDVAIGGGDADDATSGSAHVFLRSDGVWYHQQELTSPERGGNLGYSVATSTNAAVVGAPTRDSGAGAAYIFEIDGTLAHPLSGDRLVIKNRVPEDGRRNQIKLTLKDSSLWLPVPLSSTDPTLAGAVLRIESSTSGQVFEQVLPAANWRRRGTGQSTASYRYADRELDAGACKSASLTKGKLSVTCTGKRPSPVDYDLVAGQVQPPVRVTLQFAAGVGYCSEHGGVILHDGSDGRLFSSRHAPAPASCQ